MKKTILNDWHRAQGATMVEFGGWDMPVSYTSLSDEHKATREAAGLFDISHMGQVLVRGPQALAFLQRLTTNDVSALTPGKMQYSLMLAEDGGVIDDLIVSRLEDGEGYYVVVNAGTAEADLAWASSVAGGMDVAIEPLLAHSMFALQGPRAQEIMQELTSEKLDGLKYYTLSRGEAAGAPIILSRSGYTGEDGFEISVRHVDAPGLWHAIVDKGRDKGLKPIGLGARNTLRLEMGYALYGHEISREITPYEAGLAWVVKPAKGDFIGRAAIEAKRSTGRKLAAFEMAERGVARDGYPVLDAQGARIGAVTSASPSPSTGKNVGLAYVPEALSKPGAEIWIEVRGKAVKAVVVKLPFTPSHVRKT